jgi:hypothetical protein
MHEFQCDGAKCIDPRFGTATDGQSDAWTGKGWGKTTMPLHSNSEVSGAAARWYFQEVSENI